MIEKKLSLLLVIVVLAMASVANASEDDFVGDIKTTGKKLDNASTNIIQSEEIINNIDKKIEDRKRSREEFKKSMEEIKRETDSIARELEKIKREMSNYRNSINKKTKSPTMKIKKRGTQRTIKTDKREILQVKKTKKQKKPPARRKYLREYRVRPGDTLSSISLIMYGNSAMWKKIYEANKDKLPDPSAVYVGQILVIP